MKVLIATALAALTMTPSLESKEPPPGVSVELRTFIAHGDLDGRGLSCVVTNGSDRPVTAWKGYDGGHNCLVNRQGYPLSLRPVEKREAKRVTIQPGMSETIFTLSIDSIFFLRPEQKHRAWRWGWHESPPRGAPPVSPFHWQYSLGWEVRRADSAEVAAEVEVEGSRIASPQLEIRANKLRTETVKVHARLDTADWQQKREPNYEIRLRVLKDLEGSLTNEERTLRLPWGDSEHLLSAGRARLVDKGHRYAFAGPSMNFTFTRVLSEDGKTLTTVLMSYEKAAEAIGPLCFAAQDGTPLITAHDVVSYEWRTHTIRFRPGTFARLRQAHAGDLVRGVPFTLRLGEIVIYPGVFTTGASSISKSLPVILLDAKDAATIQLGYPTEDDFNGEDPRADKRLRTALEESKLLRR